MKKIILVLSCLFFQSSIYLLTAEELLYEFIGHHLVASYKECDEQALKDLDSLESAFLEAARASNALVLSSSKFIFPGNGLTMVVLLSESHASIHTYPEQNACFVDLFTCGHTCDATKFEAVLENYLKPGNIDRQLLLRE